MAGIDYSPKTYIVDRTVDGAIEPDTNPHGGGWQIEHNGQRVIITDALLKKLLKHTPPWGLERATWAE